MPRQAACLVLGRSARARTASEASSTHLRTFSTTPLRWADNDDASSSSGRNNPDDAGRAPSPYPRRVSSVDAASRLGALGGASAGSSRPSSRGGVGGFNANISRPAGAPRLGNIISMKSLPMRGRGGSGGGGFVGAPRPLLNRPSQLGSGGFNRSPPGAPGSAPRFAPGASGARGGGGFFRGRSGGGRPRGRMSRGRGRGGGGGGGGRGGAQRKNDDDEGGNGEDDTEIDIEAMLEMPLAENIQTYVKEVEEGSVVRQYKPSTTLESLIGWGPAVATNTALGQAETAVRAMRILGGGRAHSELEQSFGLTDLRRWTSAGKPINYSRLEQKEASLRMLRPKATEDSVNHRMQAHIEKLKKKHGEDYQAFVKEFLQEGGSMSAVRDKITEKVEASFTEHLVNDVKLEHTKVQTTKEAIIKYGIKGDHPEVKYAEDTWGKLARYYAHSATYRPADAAKFDEKMRSLVKT